MNKIFKTIWNRARRSYVAVNEAVCGAAQADGKTVSSTTVRNGLVAGKVFVLTAIALAVLNAQAETILSGTVSGNYNNLTITGDKGIVDVGTVQTETSKVWDANPYTYSVWNSYNDESGGGYWSTEKVYIKSPNGSWYATDTGYMDSTDESMYAFVDKYGYDVYRTNGQDEDFSKLEAAIPSANIDANITIEKGTTLNVGGNVTIGKITQSSSASVIYTFFEAWENRDWSESGGTYWEYTLAQKTYQATKAEEANANLINNGGNVDVGEIVFENPENTYTQNGGSTSIDDISGDGSVIINDGTLSTNAGVLIDIAEAKAAQIDAKELFAPTTAITVSSLAAGEKSHVSGISATGDQFTINGGTLNIEGTYEQSIADQAETLLKDYYGQNINVTFDEVVADQTLDLSNGYTTAVLKSIYDENNRSDVLFHTLNWNAQNADITIGSGDMAESIGVKNIDNARQVTVTNGKTFAILGDGSGSSVNGTFVADNGNLVFGAEGLASGGTVNSVTMRNNGSVTIANGSFNLTSVSGKGNFTIASSSAAFLNDHQVDGLLANDGDLTVTGTLTFADGSTFTSSGNLTTNQDNVFQNVTPSVIDPLKVIGVAAQMPEEVQTVAAELFRKYVPGEVADALAQHASFTDGLVTITGVNLTETQVADLTQAFKEKLFLPNSSHQECFL